MYDNVEYLASLGKAQTAAVKRDAEIGVAQVYTFIYSSIYSFITYRVLIIYCVFQIFKNIPDPGFSLFFLGVSVCTHTRQVENQRCSRTGRVQKNLKTLRKKHNI